LILTGADVSRLVSYITICVHFFSLGDLQTVPVVKRGNVNELVFFSDTPTFSGCATPSESARASLLLHMVFSCAKRSTLIRRPIYAGRFDYGFICVRLRVVTGTCCQGMRLDVCASRRCSPSTDTSAMIPTQLSNPPFSGPEHSRGG
jgi:hypothetical protein